MDLLRKKWLRQSDDYIRAINEKERFLAELKKEKAPAYRLRAVENEIEMLVTYYNNTEEIINDHVKLKVILTVKNVLLSDEIRKLITLLHQIREFSTDPNALTLLVSDVHDRVTDITKDGSIRPPNKKFQEVADLVLKKMDENSKEFQRIAETVLEKLNDHDFIEKQEYAASKKAS